MITVKTIEKYDYPDDDMPSRPFKCDSCGKHFDLLIQMGCGRSGAYLNWFTLCPECLAELISDSVYKLSEKAKIED